MKHLRQTIDRICSAIEAKQGLQIEYQGRKRTIFPIAIGQLQSGNNAVLCWSYDFNPTTTFVVTRTYFVKDIVVVLDEMELKPHTNKWPSLRQFTKVLACVHKS